jgi:hypothetical protein
MGCTSPSPKTRPILGQEHEIENSNRLPSQGGVLRYVASHTPVPPPALAPQRNLSDGQLFLTHRSSRIFLDLQRGSYTT